MFGRQDSRRRKAERIAGQAWDQLTSAVDQAGATTKQRATVAYHDASQRLDKSRKEAAKRANAAYAALAGRRPRTHWEWLAAAALVGAAAGWTVREVTRRATAADVELPDSLAPEFTHTRS